jgi:hypothetical protein
MPLSHKVEDSGLALSAESPVSMTKKETVAAGREQSASPARISVKARFFMKFLHFSYRQYGDRNLSRFQNSVKIEENEVLRGAGKDQGRRKVHQTV